MMTTSPRKGLAGDGASETSCASIPRAATVARTSLRAAALAPASVTTYTAARAIPTCAARSSVAGGAARNHHRATTTAATPTTQTTADIAGTSPSAVYTRISTDASVKNTPQRTVASRLREYVSNAAPPSESQSHGSMMNAASP